MNDDESVVQQRVAKLLDTVGDGGPDQAGPKCNRMLAAINARESDLMAAAARLRANYDGTTRDWTGNGAND